MSKVSPEVENGVLQAVRLLQKRKGVTTRKLIDYLVTSCGFRREKEFLSSVRRVLKRSVRRGEAQKEGYRYKLLPKRELNNGMCQCKSRLRTDGKRQNERGSKRGEKRKQ
ncbi:hypothetical protein GE061_016858 [Apolygus lucorum]|uniref:Uncharacterized protein n=1 Tax=Apolygus lucorum TaxID=248454 RepID=A0A6A4K042_APOLU|nr:hypothetical protein GE061_016858 [Apolygus lucorum]